MVVLLAISTLTAALAPQIRREEDTTTSTTETTRASPLPTGGERVRVRLDTGAERPRGITLEEGDQLSLAVRSEEPAQIEIAGLGLLEDVLPLSPARFDVLATRAGTFAVRRLAPPAEPRRVATIVVTPEPNGR